MESRHSIDMELDNVGKKNKRDFGAGVMELAANDNRRGHGNIVRSMGHEEEYEEGQFRSSVSEGGGGHAHVGHNAEQSASESSSGITQKKRRANVSWKRRERNGKEKAQGAFDFGNLLTDMANRVLEDMEIDCWERKNRMPGVLSGNQTVAAAMQPRREP